MAELLRRAGSGVQMMGLSVTLDYDCRFLLDYLNNPAQVHAGRSTSMQTMQAIRIEEAGGPEVLKAVSSPIPEPRNGEVLVRVAAAGVNRPDVLQRMGRYPPPADADPRPGLEVAGVVVSGASSVGRFKPGDRVMALTHGGGYAEYCRVHESHCLPVPGDLSMTLAAAVPETFFTVYYNVFMRTRLAPGEIFLVHGGASGIGTTAIQLAKAAGATVITTAGSDEKCRFCEKLGAVRAINYRAGDWQQAVREVAGEHGVDVVLDIIAGPYVQKNIEVLAMDGRYVLIAFLKGSTAEFDLRAVLARRLTITGSLLRPQSIEEKASIAAAVEANVLPLLASGAVAPVIHAVFPLADAAKAHALMESNRHIGKIVLEVG